MAKKKAVYTTLTFGHVSKVRPKTIALIYISLKIPTEAFQNLKLCCSFSLSTMLLYKPLRL